MLSLSLTKKASTSIKSHTLGLKTSSSPQLRGKCNFRFLPVLHRVQWSSYSDHTCAFQTLVFAYGSYN